MVPTVHTASQALIMGKRSFSAMSLDSTAATSMLLAPSTRPPLSTVSTSSYPASKRSQVSATSGSNRAAKAEKVTPAVALVGMQGSINHLTSMLEQTFTAVSSPPAARTTDTPDIVLSALKLLSGVDKMLPLDQRRFMMKKIREDNSIAMFYVGVADDDELRHTFISDLYDEYQQSLTSLAAGTDDGAGTSQATAAVAGMR